MSKEATPANDTSHQAPAPEAAKTVAKGTVTERELQLEKENAKLKRAVKQTADSKRKVEVNNAYLANENHQLKQVPAPQPKPEAVAKSKDTAWGFFGRN